MVNREKFANSVLGLEREDKGKLFVDETTEKIIARERAEKFNDEVGKYEEMMSDNKEEFEKSKEVIEYDINTAEIKPMFNRIIIKPFKQNPFQKMITKGNLIIDAGGYTPHTELNPMTGKYEEQDQFIITGYVVEVGPETKYLKEGDVVYYRKDTAVPVPFFKQNFVSLGESQIIAVVNENLTERFKNVK